MFNFLADFGLFYLILAKILVIFFFIIYFYIISNTKSLNKPFFCIGQTYWYIILKKIILFLRNYMGFFIISWYH